MSIQLTDAELKFLLGDKSALTGLEGIALDQKLRVELRSRAHKMPPRWREAVQERIARGEHQVFPPEAAKGVKVLPSGRTKILDKKLEKFYAAEAGEGASALKSDDLLAMMDL